MSRKTTAKPMSDKPSALLCSIELMKTEKELERISREMMTLGERDAELGMDLLACSVSIKYVRSYLDEQLGSA